ncbi:MAG: cornichon protein-domain-containing protein [Monoraphidium minutum]|nr:MAG: cornichon protein-domain-containing protein [Monoraphidium minutum]
MSPHLLVWVAALIMQSALLGRSMYAIMSLSDLENDFLNPYDLCSRLNRFVAVEYGVQGGLALILLLSGNWFTGACHLALLGYMVHLWAGGRVYVDTTDAFRQLPQQKRQKLVLLAAHTVLFMLVVYRLIEAAIHALLTPEGRAVTQRLLKEAVGSVHGY